MLLSADHGFLVFVSSKLIDSVEVLESGLALLDETIFDIFRHVVLFVITKWILS